MVTAPSTRVNKRLVEALHHLVTQAERGEICNLLAVTVGDLDDDPDCPSPATTVSLACSPRGAMTLLGAVELMKSTLLELMQNMRTVSDGEESRAAARKALS